MAEDEAEQDDAARAFDGIADELGVLRRTIERFEDQLERVKPRNYDATLGEIRTELAGVGKHLDRIAASPGVKVAPEDWARQAQAVGSAHAREAAQQMETARRQLADTAGQLQRYLVQGVTAEQQARERLQWAGIGGIGGVFLCMVLFAAILLLPASWHMREKLAARIMGEDRWSAAEDMARSAQPQEWAAMVYGAQLEKLNREALQACFRQSARTGKEQRCTIRVTAKR